MCHKQTHTPQQRSTSFLRFSFSDVFLELIDPVLQFRNTRAKQTDIEKRLVLGRRIKSIALTQPRRIIDLDVCETEMLKDRGTFRCARPTLTVNDGLLVGIEL
jgi:hypothetical protein